MSGITDLLIDPPKCASDHTWNNAIREAYRRGYNDHASAQASANALYGTTFNQHGPGENP